jgi:hypothetical protein
MSLCRFDPKLGHAIWVGAPLRRRFEDEDEGETRVDPIYATNSAFLFTFSFIRKR